MTNEQHDDDLEPQGADITKNIEAWEKDWAEGDTNVARELAQKLERHQPSAMQQENHFNEELIEKIGERVSAITGIPLDEDAGSFDNSGLYADDFADDPYDAGVDEADEYEYQALARKMEALKRKRHQRSERRSQRRKEPMKRATRKIKKRRPPERDRKPLRERRKDIFSVLDKRLKDVDDPLFQ